MSAISKRFDAHLTAYMPAYLALLDKQVMKSVCGYRIAEQEPLFLEQYLDEPADRLLAQRFACPIPRGKLIEFGHLASFGRGLSAFHFRLMAQQLVAMGFEWCIFTATDPLHALMRRFGLQPTLIAQASPARIPMLLKSGELTISTVRVFWRAIWYMVAPISINYTLIKSKRE